MQLTEATRAWFYRIVTAAFALALVYGIIDRDNIDEWIGLVGAILGVGTGGLASLFTSTRRPEQPEARDGDLDRGEITVIEIAALVLILCGIVWLVVQFRNG